MKSQFTKILFLIILVAFCNSTFSQVQISPNDSLIIYKGLLFPELDSNKAILNRHSDAVLAESNNYINYDKARTQSGVVIKFSTTSPTITLNFETRLDGNQSAALRFNVYEDNVFHSTISDSILVINSNSSTSLSEYEIVLPIFYAVNFLGLELDNGHALSSISETRLPVYVSIGNSITHGRGQVVGDETYPFKIAKNKGWDLYNLAVGGSKIAPRIWKDLSGIQADVITILWGYNDWNTTMSYPEIADHLMELLKGLRSIQPCARIYYITPTQTTKTSPTIGSKDLDLLRDSLALVVNNLINAGDEELYLLRGEEFSDTFMLNDVVHFDVPGAARFSDSLGLRISLPVCPIVNLGDDMILCEDSLLLDASQCHAFIDTSGIIYNWNTGVNNPQIMVLDSGTYTVEITKSGCPNVYDTISISLDGIDISDDTLCGNGRYNFNSPSIVIWLDPITDSIIQNSDTLSIVSTGNEVEVEAYKVGNVSGYVGKPSASTDVWNNASFDTNKLLFECYDYLIIDSVVVYTQTSGDVTIRILTGDTSQLIKSFTGSVAAGYNNLPVHFLLTPGTYAMDAVGTNIDLRMENGADSSTLFPYEILNLISINNTLPAWNLNNNRYNYFYNWKVRSLDISTCGPEVVKGIQNCFMDCNEDSQGSAFLDSCGSCSGGNTGITPILNVDSCNVGLKDDMDHNFSIYPNPFKNSFIIQNKLENALNVTIYSSLGKIIESYTIEKELEIGYELNSGMYFVFFNNLQHIPKIKLIKQ